ncbi:hypothetical protein L1887_57667 [Cichorium endivia]|nr:hypothetical protein L1887_57667 [Cichorium endivia]
MKPWRLRLRTMTAITITTMLIFAVALVYFGVSWYADNIEERIIAQLSPDAAKAFSDIDLGMMPDQRQLQALVELRDPDAGTSDDGTPAEVQHDGGGPTSCAPLSPILRGRLHGIADDVFPLDKQAIRHLIVHVEGLARLVDDLRTLSLAETNSLVKDTEPLDLAAECAAVAEAARPLMDEVGIDLDMSLEPAPVCGDRQRPSAASDGRAFFAIEDKGPGFPAGVEAHGIELFWRMEPSRARKTGGTGLGLSIARAIAQAHDSDLQIKARPDGGTIVTVVFGKTS